MKDTRTPLDEGQGILAALAALARHDGFSVEISAEDARLRVTIQVDGHEPLNALGQPTALDARLPVAIARYASWIESSKAKDEVEIDLPRGMTAAAPARAAPKPAPKKPAPPKKKAPARKAAPKRAPAPRRTPAARKPASAPASNGKPDKAACIADYHAMKAKHGDKLTRRLFIANAPTGRRYEALWKESWPSFAKEAEASKGGATSGAAAGLPGATTPARPKKAAAGAPKKAAAAAPKKSAPDEPKGPWSVKLGKKKLGETIFDKKPGDSYTCSAGTFVVQLVDAARREIFVSEPTAATPPKDQASGESNPPAADESQPAATTTEEPK